MKKKIVLTLIAVAAVVGGVVGFSAFEAHIINVTAHIENALSVSPKEIKFGTVFPQEYLEQTTEIKLSDSFLAAGRVDDVEYKIVCKPKPCPLSSDQQPIDPTCVSDTADPNNIPHNPTGWHYLPLCRFLSQMPKDEQGDIGKASYYNPGNGSNIKPFCAEVVYAAVQNYVVGPQGRLSKAASDTSDVWTIDLKVPPVKGYVGQDWPESCASWVVEQNDKTYGADLWVEVTGISLPPSRYPLEGTAYIGYEDWTDGDLDYNDFGMDFSAQEYYDTIGGKDYLTKVVMTFEAVIYDSGANHYIHIRRPFNGNYSYKVTRGASYAGEIAAGDYAGSGQLDLVLFNTAKYNWPQKHINELVTIEVTLANPSANPRMPLVAPRPDLDPFMDNYDPWENPYEGVVGTFEIAHIETIGSTAAQKNTPRIVPVGTQVPFILVIPKTDWVPPFEDTTITAPYWHFTDYYDGIATNWGPAWPDWYLSLDPAHIFVGPGGLAW